jgi:hypothetical protein
VDSELGPLLIEAGMITPSQLAQALAARHRQGGILLARLLDARLVEEDQIVNLFCTRRSFRRAASGDLLDIPEDIISLVPPHLAWRHGVVPLSLEGDTLYLAAADPSDTQVQAQLAYLTGYRVTPLVVRFSDLQAALSRSYGRENTPFPPSYPPPYDPYENAPFAPPLQSDDELVALLTGADEEPSANTLPGLGAPVRPPNRPRFYANTPTAPRFYAFAGHEADQAPQQTLRGVGADHTPTIRTQAPPQASDDETPTLRIDAPPRPAPEPAPRPEDDAGPTIIITSTPPPAPSEKPASALNGPARLRRFLERLPPLTTPRPVGQLFGPPDETIDSLNNTQTIQEVLDRVFAYLAPAFPRQVFFLVRPGLAQGYRGVDLPYSAHELRVPLNTPSLFTSILLSQFPFVGEVLPTPATRPLLQRLGTPCFAVLLPVLLGERAIGVFFADLGDPRRGADGNSFIHLRRVAASTSQAIVRLLQRKPDEAAPETKTNS